MWTGVHVSLKKSSLGGSMRKLIGGMLVLAGLIALPVFAAVNINTATQSELESVKGLGPAKAQAIISYREANGGFKSLDELDNVKGFGKASVDKLKGDLSVGAEKAKQ
jgi:competence protein ComEA